MQALSQLSYSPTKAGTLRAGRNPVKALSCSYYAFEIIGLASPARSESGAGPASAFTRPDRKPTHSIYAIPPFTQPQLRATISASSRLKNDSITVAMRTPRAADEALPGFQREQGIHNQLSCSAYIIATFPLMETAPSRPYFCWYKQL